MRAGDHCVTIRVHVDQVEIDMGDMSMGMLGWISLPTTGRPLEDSREEFICQK
jgi:hypothetical protein